MSGAHIIIHSRRSDAHRYLGEVGDAQSCDITLDLGVFVALGVLEAIDDWVGVAAGSSGLPCRGLTGKDRSTFRHQPTDGATKDLTRGVGPEKGCPQHPDRGLGKGQAWHAAPKA